jgi:hypothetical protein
MDKDLKKKLLGLYALAGSINHFHDTYNVYLLANKTKLDTNQEKFKPKFLVKKTDALNNLDTLNDYTKDTIEIDYQKDYHQLIKRIMIILQEIKMGIILV